MKNGSPGGFAAARLAECERAMRATAAVGRRAVRAGAFEAFLAPPGASRFLSVAVPVGDPRAKDIYALERLFAVADTPLRVEYFAERHPRLADLLLEEGLSSTRSDPVMVVEPPTSMAVPAAVPGSAYEEPASDSAGIAELLVAQSQAFGMIDTADGWEAILREGIRAGLFRAGMARDRSGHVTSAALLLGDGRVAELAGVGTLDAHRRQGLARFVCGRLIASGFRGGLELIWLSADSSAVDLYRQLGFRTVGTQRNFESNAGR